MHLVKREVEAPKPLQTVGGFAGWLRELVRALWVGAQMHRTTKRQLSVVETLSIGGKKQLVLVNCGGAQFLVGTGAESVQTIVRVHSTDAVRDEVSQVRGLGERQ